jgi:PAS domain S-box-containing protein
MAKKSGEIKKTKVKSRPSAESRSVSRRALPDSEKKYLALLENIQEGYFETDLAGNFTFFNDALCRIHGYSRKELMGMNNRQYTEEETAKRVYKAFHNIYLTGKPLKEFDWQIIRKDGERRYIEASVSLHTDSSGRKVGFSGVIRDITERKKTEELTAAALEALHQSEEKYRNILESIQEGYFETDLAGNFTFVNDAVSRDLGYKKNELIGMNYRQYADRETVKDHFHIFRRIYDTGDAVDGLFWQITRKDGVKRYFESSASLRRDSSGKSIGFRGIVRDITERKLGEEKLHQAFENIRKAFNATIQVMVAAVEMRDPYTAGHQLRATDLARAIAVEMGLPRNKVDGLRMAGSIHDIGKLSIPTEILSRPVKLTDVELVLIRKHPGCGYQMLKNVESPWPLAQIIYQHHERMDGSGYPRNLKADQIIMEARILAVADVVEAMASHRPYRAALGIDAALQEIENNKGSLYDNEVADVCIKLFRKKGYQLPSI